MRAVARGDPGTGELTHDPGELRERAGELLSRPPYREEPPGLLERAVTAVRQWLAELIDGVVGAVAADAMLAWLVVGIGLALLLLVVWRSTRGLTVDRSVETAASGEGGGRPARDWHALADDHEAAGAWDEAVRCRYVALVTRLAELGVIEEVPGRTVGELDAELHGSAPALAPAVAEAGGVFAEVAYGRLPADRARARRLGELAERTERRAQGGRRLQRAGAAP